MISRHGVDDDARARAYVGYAPSATRTARYVLRAAATAYYGGHDSIQQKSDIIAYALAARCGSGLPRL